MSDHPVCLRGFTPANPGFIRRRPGTKGSQLWPLGLVHWQASWPLSTPSGQDVSLSEEESPPESPFVAGRRTPSRAETGLLSNTRK